MKMKIYPEGEPQQRNTMIRNISLMLIILLPVILLSQESTTDTKTDTTGSSQVKTQIPVQAQYSNRFKIRHVNFNKRIDLLGKGEILEIEFVIVNQTDNPIDLYIFTIATHETKRQKDSYFKMPIDREKKLNFVPYPMDLDNFRYPKTDYKGNPVKDESGNQKMSFIKFPKNPKAGINKATGKPYHLENKLVVRTQHLSKYRVNYTYFNEATLLIFDKDGKPVFRQLYKLIGIRSL